MTSKNEPSKRLFIGSLPYSFTEGDLLRLFVAAGKVIDVRIMRYRFRSRGMGYVEFETLEEATLAHKMFHNYKMVDRTIIVDFAQPDTKPKFEDEADTDRRPPQLQRLHSSPRRSSAPSNRRPSGKTTRHSTFHRRSDSGKAGRHGRK